MSLCYCIPFCRCLDQHEQFFGDGCTKKQVWNGPGVVCIGPFYSGEKRLGITLQQNEYIRIRDTLAGEEHIVLGPTYYFLKAYEQQVDNGPQTGACLGPIDYLKVIDKQSGEVEIVKGPTLWFPKSPYQHIVKQYSVIPLKHNEYVRIVDQKTGVQRIAKGEALVYLTVHEEIIDGSNKEKGVKKAINIDEHTAVLVRNTKTGQLRLLTENKLFFPEVTEEIVKIQQKIILQDHQAVVLRDKDGKFIIKGGKMITPKGKEEILADDLAIKTTQLLSASPELKLGKGELILDESKTSKDSDSKKKKKEKDKGKEKETAKETEKEMKFGDEDERSFFVPPYCELLTLEWFVPDDVQRPKEKVTYFDLRPTYLTYQFSCRSIDNVELKLDLTFFWEIIDISLMVSRTDDLPTDMCNHARSAIIQDVSQVTFQKFMAEFNQIIKKAVLDKPDTFYSSRGAQVHSVEVRSIRCADPNTEKVLQDIIKQTTDRLNKLQKQASENEVKLHKMKGEIDAEKLNGDLLKIRYDHRKSEAVMEGEAEADAVHSFLTGLKNSNVPLDTSVNMWQILRKLDAMDELSKGNSQIYVTPPNTNLSIETLTAPYANHLASMLPPPVDIIPPPASSTNRK